VPETTTNPAAGPAAGSTKSVLRIEIDGPVDAVCDRSAIAVCAQSAIGPKPTARRHWLTCPRW